VERYVECGFCL